ncbi:hypothetical protein [Phytohabitans rumicis]|uniref:Uncharacterized protein n=1 Tax=Phytohabitans rumicis TaxID=1076125 RepID=A0A6V8KRT5_9ACTN|nr:hypothetical protein [Phytohabitans rumicis]GFJ86564.1 hypothetical protein Prum_002060 [Phytohabitans rumicis]
MAFHKAPPGHAAARSGLAVALVVAFVALVSLAFTSGLAAGAAGGGRELAALVRSWWPIEGSGGS